MAMYTLAVYTAFTLWGYYLTSVPERRGLSIWFHTKMFVLLPCCTPLDQAFGLYYLKLESVGADVYCCAFCGLARVLLVGCVQSRFGPQ